MNKKAILFSFFCVLGMAATALSAQELSALARVVAGSSGLRDAEGALELRLTLSQGVPYRVFHLNDPKRIIIDFNEVDWRGVETKTLDQSDMVTDLRVGVVRAGWSRMVLDIQSALTLTRAEMLTPAALPAVLSLRFEPATEDTYAASAGAPKNALLREPNTVSATPPLQRQTGERDIVVVLDPGHGGIDPGAQNDGAVEANLMLAFALELKETLLRAGRFKVVLTRDENIFVPLETRVSRARAANADVFLSLHADSLVAGRASGATIYTLSETASDVASQKLAERHDRGDLLSGVDLSAQDDVIATVLMEMARTETAPRTEKLAKSLVAGLTETVGMHKRPLLSAGFSVLKSPDIPSILLELGFLSSPRDLEKLRDPDWRALATQGILAGLRDWAEQDAADALLIRK